MYVEMKQAARRWKIDRAYQSTTLLTRFGVHLESPHRRGRLCTHGVDAVDLSAKLREGLYMLVVGEAFSRPLRHNSTLSFTSRNTRMTSLHSC